MSFRTWSCGATSAEEGEERTVFQLYKEKGNKTAEIHIQTHDATEAQVLRVSPEKSNKSQKCTWRESEVTTEEEVEP